MAETLSRRALVQLGFGGLMAAAVPGLRRPVLAATSAAGSGRAKRCIVLFSWGGMSHLDTFDMKPLAADGIRSKFDTIETSVPGIQVCEHLPHLAKRMHHLAVVRSVHHKSAGHREAAYWNLTGHPPRQLSGPVFLPSREDWPSLGSMVSHARWGDQASRGELPGTVSLPYEIADRGLLNGQHAGMLGVDHAPVYVKPKGGRSYNGVSPEATPLSLDPVAGVDADRLDARRQLLAQVEALGSGPLRAARDEPLLRQHDYRQQAYQMITGGKARDAFDLSLEPDATRAAYGDHICGQSVLTARRLTEAGVPLVTVYCNAGDLNGGSGDHWDTHGDGFRRLSRDLLPPLDQASGALLDDLEKSGRLDETLVVWFTEFGRTPTTNPTGGRNHFPNCYSVAFAGGGIRGGQVYGRSDATGSAPAEHACGPEELHATVLRALGIDPHTTFVDLQGRPRFLCEAESLPLF